MNRRSMVQTALATCAAWLFPWRKAAGIGSPVSDEELAEVNRRSRLDWPRVNESAVARIWRLLEEMQPKVAPNLLDRLVGLHPNVKRYCPAVTSIDRFGPVLVGWFDGPNPESKRVGSVLVDKVSADSLDDRALSDHLLKACLLAVDPRTHGRYVWIRHRYGYGEGCTLEVTCELEEYDIVPNESNTG